MTASTKTITARVKRELFTRPQAADYCSLSPHTLAMWAVQGKGPRFIRLGRAVRYDRAELDRWLDVQTVQSTGEADELAGR